MTKAARKEKDIFAEYEETEAPRRRGVEEVKRTRDEGTTGEKTEIPANRSLRCIMQDNEASLQRKEVLKVLENDPSVDQGSF